MSRMVSRILKVLSNSASGIVSSLYKLLRALTWFGLGGTGTWGLETPLQEYSFSLPTVLFTGGCSTLFNGYFERWSRYGRAWCFSCVRGGPRHQGYFPYYKLFFGGLCGVTSFTVGDVTGHVRNFYTCYLTLFRPMGYIYQGTLLVCWVVFHCVLFGRHFMGQLVACRVVATMVLSCSAT